MSGTLPDTNESELIGLGIDTRPPCPQLRTGPERLCTSKPALTAMRRGMRVGFFSDEQTFTASASRIRYLMLGYTTATASIDDGRYQGWSIAAGIPTTLCFHVQRFRRFQNENSLPLHHHVCQHVCQSRSAGNRGRHSPQPALCYC